MRTKEHTQIVRWLPGAVLLHALLMLCLPDKSQQSSLVERRAAGPLPHTELEVAIDVTELSAPAASDVDVPELGAPHDAQVAANHDAVRSAQLSAPAEAPAPAEGLSLLEQAASDQAPRISTASGESATGSSAAATSANGSSAQAGVASGAPSQAASASARSLADLGYGRPLYNVVAPHLKYEPLAAAQARLDRTIAQETLALDHDRGVGIDGPVTQAVRSAAFGVVAPDSLSKFAVTIGSDGRFADFRIISTNRDAASLRELALGVGRQLAAQRVAVPKGRAVEFIYEVKSQVLLPSGARRGPDLSVLPEGAALPSIAVGVDPVDVGSVARQVVHARLIQQRVL